MKNLNRSAFITGAMLVVLALLQGCSSPRESVHLTLCKNLVRTLSEQPGDIELVSNKHEMARFEDLRIMLEYEVRTAGGGAQPLQAVCVYEYDTAIEESILTDVDPFSAYKTMPYQMTIDGISVPKRILGDAVTSAIFMQGKEFAEKVKARAGDAAQRIKSAVTNESPQ